MPDRPIVTASLPDTARIIAAVLVPAIAQGVIRRRPAVTRHAARRGWDARAVVTLRDIAARYGGEPLRLRLPGRTVAMVLNPAHVDEILTRTPEPYSPATTEKRAALRHFQPHGVLISTGHARERRRELTEAALATGQEHPRLPDFQAVVARELEPLLHRLERGSDIDWTTFAAAWWRVVRQVVFGAAARDDHTVTDDLAALRSRANWAYLVPRHRRRIRRLHQSIQRYIDDGDPHSLAGYAAAPGLAAQVPHWLFAFDAAGISIMRCLALLARGPGDVRERAAIDAAYARACFLETVRLYPTTLVILRETTRSAVVGDTRLPAHATLVVHSGYFHRHASQRATTGRFTPESWLGGAADRAAGIVPFSAGPAACPGRDLVEDLATAAIMALAGVPLTSPGQPIPADGLAPGSLDHFTIRLAPTALVPVQ